VRGEVPLELISLPCYSEEHARYLRAELLQELDRHPESLRWFTTAFENTPNEVVYLAPVALHRAQLAERTGARREAADYYAQFIRLWEACDPELRPMVTEARRRLAAIGSP
jgi:tetratricopeptide (TPR) repeat protein